MPRLRILCMAHPAVWASVCKKPKDLCKKVTSLTDSSRSWLKLSEKEGQRLGIYKVEKIDDFNCLAYFADESEPNPDYQSVEMILKSDGCLPDGVSVPKPVPKASKALIFLDLKNGLCYVYTPGIPSSEDSVTELLNRLSKDTGIPCNDPKAFVWKEDFPSEMHHAARKEGFVPYRVEADLETVKITAIGDLDENEQWKKIEGSLDSERWNTIAYVKSRADGKFIFGLTRRMKKFVSIPETGEKTPNETFKEILRIKELFEKALGMDIRQYLFPEPISTLHSFIMSDTRKANEENKQS